MGELPLPLSGRTLVVGPSNVGKTRLTARAMEAWVAAEGPEGCVVLDFAPEVERDGTILGGHLTQFTSVPEGVWHGVVDAHAPRADSECDGEAVELARENAAMASVRLDDAPTDPRCVFVNDATIPAQADPEWIDRLLDYCDRGEVAVLNAFEDDEFGPDSPVSRNERAALRRLRAWADRVIEPRA
ncbi:hypothetical protein [Haloarcula nitratireducens]|uniref:Uncharacterized protein n=1 Tax=Haloarcula nitratireducens TaxID=2487749 RepID=A0AAW4PAI8_9EURY|nr:hypothetical protein [Halomicroarcula nitratireducens]MBX0294768.1 hypothetical protein [Halomicroarcula nitratireducens]